MVLKHLYPQSSFVTFFTGFSRRVYFVEALIDCGIGGSGGCPWNNKVSRNRVLEEMKVQGITSPGFSEIRRIAEKTIREDIRSMLEEQKGASSYIVNYRRTENGLTVVGGLDDGKLFHTLFIDRPLEQGPDKGVFRSAGELQRLKLIEQHMLDGKKQLITATSEDGRFGYLEVWQTGADGVVTVRGMRIGKVAGDLSSQATSEVIQKVLGLRKSQVLDQEGLLFAVEGGNPAVFFDTAAEYVKTHKESLFPPKEKPLDLHFNSVNNQSKLNHFDTSQKRNTAEAEKRKIPDPVIAIVQSAEKLVTKSFTDTRMTLVSAGVFLFERWRKKWQKKKAEKKNINLSRGKEPLVIRVWKKLFEKPGAIVLQRKENAKVSKKENSNLLANERRSIVKPVGLVEKVTQIIRQPKKMVERFSFQVTRIQEKAIHVFKGAKILVAKKAEQLGKKPFLQLKERALKSVFYVKEKVKIAFKKSHEIAVRARAKVKEKSLSMFQFFKSRFIHSVIARISSLKNAEAISKRSRLPRFTYAWLAMTIAGNFRYIFQIKNKTENKKFSLFKRRMVNPVRSFFKRILTQQYIKLFTEEEITASPARIVPVRKKGYEKQDALLSFVWFWVLWHKWLSYTSELKIERPQGMAFGSPKRTISKRKHATQVVYAFKADRKRGSVSVV